MTDEDGTRLTLEDVEQAIYEYYQFFAREAPGVVVQEVGHLANLWSVWEDLVREERGGAV